MESYRLDFWVAEAAVKIRIWGRSWQALHATPQTLNICNAQPCSRAERRVRCQPFPNYHGGPLEACQLSLYNEEAGSAEAMVKTHIQCKDFAGPHHIAAHARQVAGDDHRVFDRDRFGPQRTGQALLLLCVILEDDWRGLTRDGGITDYRCM